MATEWFGLTHAHMSRDDILLKIHENTLMNAQQLYFFKKCDNSGIETGLWILTRCDRLMSAEMLCDRLMSAEMLCFYIQNVCLHRIQGAYEPRKHVPTLKTMLKKHVPMLT